MNIVERVQRILMQPAQEWHVIQQEPTQPSQLYTGYIMPLAAIGPAASIIGLSAFAYGLYALSIPFIIVITVISYLLGLAGVYILALIIDALAPSFSGQKNINQALKLVAYSYTPVWLGGIFNIFPPIAVLGLLVGLYGFYLLYLGLPVMMQVPQDKAVGYIAVAIIVMIVIFFIIAAIIGAVTTAMVTSYRLR
ncbi:MAG TPA: Yip1 family protein [Blastocatellia bacterium]|nr:Yip1 family protein [Blastocatellia bacterium]